MGRSASREGCSAESDWSGYDLGEMGLRALDGRRLTFRQQRAGFVVLAADIDDDADVAAVWLVRHPASPDSAEHTLQFERRQAWRFVGGGSGSAQELSLAGRPSASMAGPASMVRLLTSSGGRIRADLPEGAAGSVPGSAGWVGCAGFRVAREVVRLRVGERMVPVPEHGFVIAVWRSAAELSRPAIAALGEDGSRLSEFSPHSSVDSATWDSLRAILGE